MVDKVAKWALMFGFLLAIYHYYVAHVAVNRPAPELMIALIILAVPVILIFSGKVKLKD